MGIAVISGGVIQKDYVEEPRFVTIGGKRIPIRPYRRQVGQYAWLHHDKPSEEDAQKAERDAQQLMTSGLRQAADHFEAAFGKDKFDHRKAKAAIQELHSLIREAESAVDSGWFGRGGEYTRGGKMVMRKPKAEAA